MRLFGKVTLCFLFFSLFFWDVELLAANRSKGIAVVFPKKLELMTRASWSSPPLDVNRVLTNMAKYDAVWCAQLIAKNNPKSWKFMRQNAPEKLMLRYVSGCSVQVNGEINRLDYNYINEHHPEWFLLADSRKVKSGDYRDSNKRTRWNSRDKKHTYYNRFYLDVANKEFQTWAAQEILSIVRGSREGNGVSYDGVALDNVYVGKRLHERFRFKYPHWKYAHDYAAWSKGYRDYLQTIKRVLNEHGFIVVANHNPVGDNRGENDVVWQMLYDSVDGILTERALRNTWRNKGYFTGDKWLAAIARNEELSSKGLINWWVCSPFDNGKIDRRAFLYTYCSWLLIKQPETSYYSFLTTGDTIPWFEEFDLPTGEPVSSRYCQNNCWVRDFTSAKIVVNPTNKFQKVVIDEKKQWLDWTSKKSVHTLKLSPRSGRILLPTPYTAKSQPVKPGNN